MQTERASNQLFARNISSRRILGGNPRINYISPHFAWSLCWYTCAALTENQRAVKTKGGANSLPYTASNFITLPQHFSHSGNSRCSEGLILTPPSLLSISFEECTRFINPTQTGAPPPLSQTNRLCSRHNKHPETKSSWRKDPRTQRPVLGGEHRKGSVMAGPR